MKIFIVSKSKMKNKTSNSQDNPLSPSSPEAKPSDVESLLEILREEVLKRIELSDYKLAIQYLKKSEELLEAIMTQGQKLIYDEVLATLQNLAYSYQKICDFQRSVTYIDACIYNINTHPVFPVDLPDIQLKLKKSVYLAKSHIQACALLSQLSSHRLALLHARRAVQNATQVLKLTLKSAGQFSALYTSCKAKARKVSESLAHVMGILSLVNPALKSIEDFLHSHRGKKPRLIPSVLGVKDHPDWTYSISLADIMLVQTVQLDEIREKTSSAYEFTKDILIMKVCVLSVSYFCTSTELQFLSEDAKEAKSLHKLSIKVLEGFLPEESRLLVHMRETFRARYKAQLPGHMEISTNFEKLPSIPDRCTSLTPSHRARRVLRKTCGRQKTFGNLDLVKNVYRSKSIDRKGKTLK